MSGSPVLVPVLFPGTSRSPPWASGSPRPAKAAVLPLWARLLSSPASPWVMGTQDRGVRERVSCCELCPPRQAKRVERQGVQIVALGSFPIPENTLMTPAAAALQVPQRQHAMALVLPLPWARFVPFSSSCRGRAVVVSSHVILSCVSQPEERPQLHRPCLSEMETEEWEMKKKKKSAGCPTSPMWHPLINPILGMSPSPLGITLTPSYHHLMVCYSAKCLRSTTTLPKLHGVQRLAKWANIPI